MNESIYSLLGEWYKWYIDTFQIPEEYVSNDSLCTRTKKALENYEKEALANFRVKND